MVEAQMQVHQDRWQPWERVHVQVTEKELAMKQRREMEKRPHLRPYSEALFRNQDALIAHLRNLYQSRTKENGAKLIMLIK